jgi:hypothetical protein
MLTSALLLAFALSGEPIGYISHVSGNVHQAHLLKPKFVTKVGNPVYEKDKFKTSSSSNLVITFYDSEVIPITLSENSYLKIPKSRNQSSNSTKLTLYGNGKVKPILPSSANVTFSIRTPKAVASVRTYWEPLPSSNSVNLSGNIGP